MAAGYYRFPTIHQDTIVFVSEDDLWTVPRQGGIARRLTSNLGEVNYPALSPDGEWLAFVGREEGMPEVYFDACARRQRTPADLPQQSLPGAGMESGWAVGPVCQHLSDNFIPAPLASFALTWRHATAPSAGAGWAGPFDRVWSARTGRDRP